MGISNLKKIIANSGVKKELSEYRGKRVGVDASIWLYRWLYRDEENAVLTGVLKQLKQFHRHQITPVYVFDGKASSDIKIEIERREMRRARVNNALDTLEIELAETLEVLGDNEAAALVVPDDPDPITGNAFVDVTNVLPWQPNDIPQFIPDSDDDDTYVVPAETEEVETLQVKAVRLQSRIQTLQKQTRRPTREIVDACKELLTILGIPFIQSPGESDIVLSELISTGRVDAIMSEDTDMLPYGCHTFVTGLKDNEDTIIEFKLNNILTDLALTREQFIDVCILCGCDYAEKIYKVGVKKGLELIKRYGNIEGILKHIDSTPSLAARHTYPSDYLVGVNIARSMFLTRTPGVDPNEDTGRTVSELKSITADGDVETYCWSFVDATASDEAQRREHYVQFLQKNAIYMPDSYMKLCQNWTGRSHSQRSLFDYYSSTSSSTKNAV